jgi:hypothetical protein
LRLQGCVNSTFGIPVFIFKFFFEVVIRRRLKGTVDE